MYLGTDKIESHGLHCTISSTRCAYNVIHTYTYTYTHTHTTHTHTHTHAHTTHTHTHTHNTHAHTNNQKNTNIMCLNVYLSGGFTNSKTNETTLKTKGAATIALQSVSNEYRSNVANDGTHIYEVISNSVVSSKHSKGDEPPVL